MIVKQRKKPYVILAYEALFRRLKEKYRNNEIINDSYQRFNAGFRGEKNVDYKLSLYPHEEFFIYHDLRLKNHSYFFQLDTLILTKKFICILEIKNMKGSLSYDSEQQQLTQTVGDKIIGYKDPIQQAEAQKRQLSFWLQDHNLFKIPIETLVVTSNPSTIITNIQRDPKFYNKWIHAESLHFHLDKLQSKYVQSTLSRQHFKKINDLLLSNDVPLRPNLIEQYNITDRHLIQGIPCTMCHYSPITRVHTKWVCPKCGAHDYLAHKRVILDYFLLQKDTITNRECRELLQISSPRTAYIFLNAMNLSHTGKNSARKYHAPYPEDFPQDAYFPNKNKSILDY